MRGRTRSLRPSDSGLRQPMWFPAQPRRPRGFSASSFADLKHMGCLRGLLYIEPTSRMLTPEWSLPMATNGKGPHGLRLRSQLWFDNPDNPGMTALYLERYLNYGITREELTAGKPIIGIAQTGSDLSPCNRHHLELAKRVREGIRDAGGIAFEFPMHPIQETGKRPTAALDRNLAYLSL